MYKKMWKDKEAVSPVIATILMVAITVVLAGVLVVYMQQFSKGPGTNAPTGGMVATAFTNPVDGQVGKTANGGGWAVTIETLSSSTTLWSQVTVQLMTGGTPVYKTVGVKASAGGTGNVWSSNLTAPNAKWYAYNAVPSTVMKYCASPYTTCASANLVATANYLPDLQTVQGCYFIVIDNDGSGTLTAGDQINVYQNYIGTTVQQIGGTGWQIQLLVGGSQITSQSLT